MKKLLKYSYSNQSIPKYAQNVNGLHFLDIILNSFDWQALYFCTVLIYNMTILVNPRICPGIVYPEFKWLL